MNDNFEPDRCISEVWRDKTLRKVFLDIICNTQLKKCRQLRSPFVKKVSECVERNMTDAEIYDVIHTFIQTSPKHIRQKIQHQGHYRGINRSNKITSFVEQYRSISSIETVLDIGCGDGSITNVFQSKMKLNAKDMHGCDIHPAKTKDFTFHKIDEDVCHLPFKDSQFDLVYALMSLHHIRLLPKMLQEVNRVLKPNGMLIIREHDCVIPGLARVLDIVHGFYAMVWCSPKEHECFQTEYFAQYRTAQEFDEIISEEAHLQRLTGTNRDEDFPIIYHGKVINPLKHYWAVYQKK